MKNSGFAESLTYLKANLNVKSTQLISSRVLSIMGCFFLVFAYRHFDNLSFSTLRSFLLPAPLDFPTANVRTSPFLTLKYLAQGVLCSEWTFTRSTSVIVILQVFLVKTNIPKAQINNAVFSFTVVSGSTVKSLLSIGPGRFTCCSRVSYVESTYIVAREQRWAKVSV